MRIFTHTDALPGDARGAVLAIGNFDGLHRGHQRVIEETRDIAARLGAPAAVLTFEPHPRRLFVPNAPPFRLTSLASKSRRLEGLGLDIERRTRAESELAVAAASILARAEFLVRLMELGEQAGLKLPKGAGALVDEAVVELARRTGLEGLAAYAKVHFKNVDKVRGLL